MKHITHFNQWSRLHESEEDQELEDIRRLVDLGLADSSELSRHYRERYSLPRREGFLALLSGMFSELGIEPFDYTTPRQRKNGTYYFQITASQAERILYDYPLPAGLTGSQGSRMQRMLREMEPARQELRGLDQVDTQHPYTGATIRSSRYQYFVYPGDIRTASWDKSPNSSGFIKFDGSKEPEAILARFIYQVALDTHTMAMRMI